MRIVPEVTHLVQGPLTTLTLRPQSGEVYLQLGRDVHLLLVQLGQFRTTVYAHGALCGRVSVVSRVENAPFEPFNGVRHPRHVAVFTANFMRPPTVGVAI